VRVIECECGLVSVRIEYPVHTFPICGRFQTILCPNSTDFIADPYKNMMLYDLKMPYFLRGSA